MDSLNVLSCGGNLLLSKEFVKSQIVPQYTKKEKRYFCQACKEKDNSAIYKIKDYLKKYRRYFLFYNTWEFCREKPKDIIKIFQRGSDS